MVTQQIKIVWGKLKKPLVFLNNQRIIFRWAKDRGVEGRDCHVASLLAMTEGIMGRSRT